MFLELYHPTTNQRLDLFTPEVMELMRSGYSINDILNLSKKIPPKYNRDNIFTNDILLNYVKNLDLKDIKSLCLIDKGAQELYQSKYLWRVKIEYCISQRYLLKNSKYIGNYTAHYYDIVLNAIGRSDLFDTGKDIFVF